MTQSQLLQATVCVALVHSTEETFPKKLFLGLCLAVPDCTYKHRSQAQEVSQSLPAAQDFPAMTSVLVRPTRQNQDRDNQTPPVWLEGTAQPAGYAWEAICTDHIHNPERLHNPHENRKHNPAAEYRESVLQVHLRCSFKPVQLSSL